MCSACFGRFLKFPACHSRRSVQVWKDEVQHQTLRWQPPEESLALGKFLVMREGEKLSVRGSERRTRLPPGCFLEGGLFLSSSSAFLLLLAALIVALRQKSRPQASAAQTFEAEATLASKPALNYLSFLFSISS